MFGEEEVIKSHKKRADALSHLIIMAFAVIVGRLWYLQVYRGKTLYEFSLQNRLRKEILRAPRGMIFSRNNQILVDNHPRFDAVLTPQYLSNGNEVLIKLSKILNLEIVEINEIINKNKTLARYKPIVLKKNISRKEVALIETQSNELPGISVETFISREYLDGEDGAHLYGYISEIDQDQLPRLTVRDNVSYRLGDYVGQFGLEKKLDTILRGENGHEFVEVDAYGRKKRHILTDNLFKGIQNLTAIPGQNVRLTIDRDLQKAASKALNGQSGSVVAIDPNTGEVLALVSSPSFDPSNFSRGLTNEYWQSLVTNEFRPMRNRAIQDHYPPGSVLKTITLIAALEEGLVDEKTNMSCKGKFSLGRRAYHCWRRGGHGDVDVVKAIRESCDVFFYRVATKLDIDILARYAKMFGLGQKTSINLPGEVSGLVPTKDWKLKRNGVEWQLGETLTCAIGQSFMLTTPIQLAFAYGALANRGTLFNPILVKEVFDNSGNITQTQSPTVKNKLEISERTWDIVQEGLHQVVNNPKGTVWWRRGLGLDMSGKTGTSQVIRMNAEKLFKKCNEHDYDDRHHGLFVGYAPRAHPKIVVSAVIEHGCSGSSAAAPVVRDVISAYMEKYQPKLHAKLSDKQRKEYREWLKAREKAKEIEENKEKQG